MICINVLIYVNHREIKKSNWYKIRKLLCQQVLPLLYRVCLASCFLHMDTFGHGVLELLQIVEG